MGVKAWGGRAAHFCPVLKLAHTGPAVLAVAAFFRFRPCSLPRFGWRCCRWPSCTWPWPGWPCSGPVRAAPPTRSPAFTRLRRGPTLRGWRLVSKSRYPLWCLYRDDYAPTLRGWLAMRDGCSTGARVGAPGARAGWRGHPAGYRRKPANPPRSGAGNVAGAPRFRRSRQVMRPRP